MQITAAEAPDLILDVLRAKRTPMLHASPGVGKSDIIRQLCETNNWLPIDIRLSQSDPTDLNGFPARNANGRAIYMPFEMFPIEGDRLPEGYNGWCIFLDEINSAPLSVQAAAYKLILDRMVGQNKLHKNVVIVAAGNLSTDRAIVNRMSTAMQSRMIHFEMRTSFDAWMDWATKSQVDFRVVAFLNFKQELLHSFNPTHEDYTFPCPRTWEFLSQLIRPYKQISVDKIALLAGTVGEAAGREFYAFSQIYKTLPTISEIQRNPTGITIPNESSTQYAIAGLIGNHMASGNALAIMQFVERLPIEFQILALQYSLRRDKKLLAVQDVKVWVLNHSKDLFKDEEEYT